MSMEIRRLSISGVVATSTEEKIPVSSDEEAEAVVLKLYREARKRKVSGLFIQWSDR